MTARHSVAIGAAVVAVLLPAANVAGQGHWHIYVNGKYNTFSANATTGRTKKLKNGDYKLYVELVNNDHSPLSEKTVSKKIRVMVHP